MSKQNVITNTYEWLQTAFANLELSKEEKILKAELIKSLCIEEIDEYILALKDDDYNEQLNACADLLVVASNLPFFAGISIDELDTECKDTFYSNMTKFCRTEKEANETVELYKAGEHINKIGVKINCRVEPTGNNKFPFKILSIPDGKILKGIGFKDVGYFRIN